MMTRAYCLSGSLRHLVVVALLWSALGGALPARAQEKENSEYKLAVGLFNDGMYDLAVEQFKNFINAYPATSQGIEARFYLGQTQLKLKRYDDARVTFQNFALAYVEHPKAPEAWMRVGEAFLGAKNEREAASAYERVRVFHPKSPLVPEALLKAGELYRRIGDRESAKRMFRTVIQDYPSSPSVLSARLAASQLFAEEGQTELAEREARRVSESDAPAEVKAGALFSLGKLHVMSSRLAEAEATFSSIIAAYPKSPIAVGSTYELGLLDLSGRAYPAAVERFKRVSSAENADDTLKALAMMMTGEAYLRQRDYGSAEKAFEKLLALAPSGELAPGVMVELGTAALLNNHAVQALRTARKLLALPGGPRRREGLLLGARAAAAAGQSAEGVKWYSLLVEEFAGDAGTPAAMIELARLYSETLHDCRKAVAVYDQIVQRYPLSVEAVGALSGTAACQESLGDIDGALKTYGELQSRYPAHDAFGAVAERIAFLRNHALKDRDGGIDKLARLMGEVLTEKTKAELSFSLGEIYFNDLKDYEAAARQFGLAIENGLSGTRLVDAGYLRAQALDLLSEADTSAAAEARSRYEAFLAQYPSAPQADDAAYGSYRLSSRLARSDRGRAGLAGGFLAQHPASAHRERVIADLGFAAAASGDSVAARAALGELLARSPQSPFGNRALLALGDLFHSAGRVDSAAACWESVVKRTPVDPATVRAISRLADLHRRAGRTPEAVALWERLSGEFFYVAAAPQARSMLPEALIADGRYDDAIAAVESGGGADSLLLLGTAYEKKGDRQRAVGYYSRSLLRDRKGPYAGRAFSALGTLARTEGRTELAASYFKQAALLGGGAATASADIADLLFETEQYADAARQYAALAQATDSLEARKRYAGRAIVSTLRSDRPAEAELRWAEYRKAYGDNGGLEAEVQFETGSYHFRRQEYPRARTAFERIAGKESRFGPWGRYYLGKIAEVNNKLDDAAKAYEEILDSSPSSDVVPRALLSLGNMYFNTERYEKAIGYYRQITGAPARAGDILPYAMNNLIEAYESTKLYDAALKTTQDFIQRYPNDEAIIDKKIKLGTLYTKIGYYDQAVLQFQNLLGEAGSLLEAEIRYNIGEAYYFKGEFQQAILEFLKVPYLVARQGKVNWTATALYMAGQAYEKMSKFDEAIGMYQQVIDRPGIDATFKSAARKEIDRVKKITKKGTK